ncbi:glycoside hydrolase family 99-like domain-containing protein [Paenibacillus sp.]|uniref:glycosyltransferase WbsX family protein n=1 Tax=Paenibacillus sp. TaxID=58172 RepID=UPI002D4C4EE2|nr:glycoside hydrolase family 99-like domain-containing protein [Paenibacillus sp.]HZG56180.1 glycoside hydrolase family 99-like domain-containing protein [Paenibacillus sp.]
MAEKPQVAVYYFPNYHVDPVNERRHGKEWTEWELVKAATPRFPGHEQPKVPLWGYEDEADPFVMARKIDAAADHGVDCFIFDWYWYDNAPFLHGGLERGFLQAANNERLKFSLMWANHDWIEIMPATRHKDYPVLAKGAASEKEFVDATNYMIETYFRHPSYWRVNGGLYVSFYELMKLIEGFGSEEETGRMLREFRERVRAAGLGELHLNAVVWGIANLPGERSIDDVNGLMRRLGFDSITSYVWIHHDEIPHFPATDYKEYREIAVRNFAKFTEEYELPYFPNVSMGWDSSPRTIQTDKFDLLGYPHTPVLTGNTPDEFKAALQYAKDFLAQGKTNPPVLTVNSWNEWTEGSYLEPDAVHGMAYLEAIREVFGDE